MYRKYNFMSFIKVLSTFHLEIFVWQWFSMNAVISCASSRSPCCTYFWFIEICFFFRRNFRLVHSNSIWAIVLNGCWQFLQEGLSCRFIRLRFMFTFAPPTVLYWKRAHQWPGLNSLLMFSFFINLPFSLKTVPFLYS